LQKGDTVRPRETLKQDWGEGAQSRVENASCRLRKGKRLGRKGEKGECKRLLKAAHVRRKRNWGGFLKSRGLEKKGGAFR